jgi:hypothetical protein
MRRNHRLELLTAAEHRRRHLPGKPLKVAADPELRAFCDEALLTMTFQQVCDAALARFGRDRAPSYGALHRYWTRMKAREPR